MSDEKPIELILRELANDMMILSHTLCEESKENANQRAIFYLRAAAHIAQLETERDKLQPCENCHGLFDSNLLNATSVDPQSPFICEGCMKNAQLTADAERLDKLEQLVHDKRLEWPQTDIVLCYDYEDGIWLAKQERGGIGVMTIEVGEKCNTLREAIDAIDAAMKGGE